MKRRGFLKSIAGALLATALAKQLTAKAPEPQWVINPAWENATHEIEFHGMQGIWIDESQRIAGEIIKRISKPSPWLALIAK